MNKFDTHNLSYLRRNHGLHWRKSYPTFHDIKNMLKTIAIIAFLVACYGLVALNDARVDAIAAELAASRMLVDLANGGTIISDDGHFAAKCEHMIEVTY